jgi:hypothetical protein
MFENARIVTAGKGSMVTMDDHHTRNISRFTKIGPEIRRDLPNSVDLLENDIEIPYNQELSAQSKTPEQSSSLQPSGSVQTSSPRM